MHDGRVVGVLCSSVRIDDVLRSMFVRYDEGDAMGFVIDRFGIVHMDSVSYMHYSLLYDEAVPIGSIDSALGYFIEDFLDRHEWAHRQALGF